MAGAGQPFYMPLTWPFGHLHSAITRSADDVAPTPKASPDLDLTGHLTSCFGAARSFAMAYACIYYVYGADAEGASLYPAFGAAAAGYEWSWIAPIVLRNVAAAWLICGCWDWFLYFSPLAAKLHKYKLNPKYPPTGQIAHDAAMTTLAVLTAAACEAYQCHQWAKGAVAFTPLWSAKSALWILGTTHWRVPHFYFVHRGMHPWKTTSVPDVGAFLYKHVHSLHHKSYNPTAFSGTNMHPVESTLYFSAAFICVPFGCHPAIFLGCIVDCAVGAWLGHDGFQWPGSGDFFHQLHHENFNCNYGAMHFPMDKWFGSYAGSKADMKKIWSGKTFTAAEGGKGNIAEKAE